MRTILLLLISNCFMTYAWYGHLRDAPGSVPLIKLILISWGIAFFEYIFLVPANNIYGQREGFSPFGLKTVQEIISLVVFAVFAVFFLKVQLRWNHVVAFLLIAAAAAFMFLPGGRRPD